ncbi:TIGR03621 family F420-dependent LLM class oxidoreductase [Kitasatospora sp. CM 4170]|uniref:TIGR03621 family F420-dependent LLM class oxidoreductase n=1 Tax=Kitasatospora aburaviensis TaxID=67265 RepID=A0ABW1EUX6_9ACTN|nr:TIGR03621 family F420-dependent LLM class oxidoreductase [Kitasatospora sp. CM 4170]WNM43712.1 TIGR03621 family F420-dependent LLM class oxidoreductase [Kitasatospora sp. CM 4170]
MARSFRFGVTLLTSAAREEWREKCRRAELLGYDVITVADHLGRPAPFPSLVAAADATERPRLGTFVLDSGFWNPTLLAREVATTDQLTDGRLELGLGTGYMKAEHDAAGLPFGTPGERVAHLQRTIEELDKLYGSGDFAPQPLQRPRPPLLVGGNGDRVLKLTARHAEIAAFTGGRADTDGKPIMLTAAQLEERVAAYRRFAADRAEPAELNLLIYMVVPTNDRRAALWPALGGIPYLTIPDLTEDEALELPTFLIGTVRQMADQLRAQRERYGFTYITVVEPAMEAFAPVIEELRGE